MVRLLIGTAALALLFRIFESVWPEDARQKRTRRETGIDLFYWFFDTLVARIAVGGAALVAIALICGWSALLATR